MSMYKKTKKKKKLTPIEVEKKAFEKKRNNLYDCILNFFFKLDKESAQRRSYLLFIFSTIVFILWIFVEISILLDDMKIDEFVVSRVFMLLLRWALVFIPPYFIAIKSASAYLSDIFELKDYGIAEQFIYQAAFASKYEKITIKDGRIAEKDKNSPIIKIGGPGEVNVDLHSVVLFEKIDGRPHIIGPTNNIENNENILNGFDRYRETIDLRDISVGPKDVSARTQDGIKIEAKDLHISFSVNRGSSKDNKKLTSYKSYPFLEDAISGAIYQHTCKVSRNTIERSVCPPWSNSMGGVFIGRLKEFISEHNLSQFVSTVGEPEKETLQTREDNYEQMKEQLLSDSSEEKQNAEKESDEGVEFHTRDKISALFSDFAQDFHQEHPKDNIVLNWIGVGTWDTPKGMIHKQHVNALILSKENAESGSEKKLGKIENEEKYKELLRLIERVPLSSGKILSAPNIFYIKAQRKLLIEYRELIETAGIYIYRYVDEEERKKTAQTFYNAIEKINHSLGHWI